MVPRLPWANAALVRVRIAKFSLIGLRLEWIDPHVHNRLSRYLGIYRLCTRLRNNVTQRRKKKPPLAVTHCALDQVLTFRVARVHGDCHVLSVRVEIVNGPEIPQVH